MLAYEGSWTCNVADSFALNMYVYVKYEVIAEAKMKLRLFTALCLIGMQVTFLRWMSMGICTSVIARVTHSDGAVRTFLHLK